MKNINCVIRKQSLVATPEERIRQAFIAYLLHAKGYPIRSIAIEFPLKSLPHLKNEPVPVDRRIDLVVFDPTGSKPLLLVECKAEKLSGEHESQVFGYNPFVKAPYVALVGAEEIRLFGPKILPELPSYDELQISH